MCNVTLSFCPYCVRFSWYHTVWHLVT